MLEKFSLKELLSSELQELSARLPWIPEKILKVNSNISQVKINQTIQRKIVNIFLPILLAYVLGAQKNRLNETVLLSIQNIC